MLSVRPFAHACAGWMEEGRKRAACVPGRFLRACPGGFCVRARAVSACVPGRFLRACPGSFCVRARAVSACVPGRFLRARPGSFCVRARAVPACVPGRFLRACFFHLLCVVGQMGYPAWLLLSGTEHAITETEDVDVVKAVYNKYKKCKKQDAFRASIDALFYVNTYKARNPSTYFADMKRIKEQFDKVVRAPFRAYSVPCVQRSVRAAFRACSVPCVQRSVRAAFRACSVPCVQRSVRAAFRAFPCPCVQLRWARWCRLQRRL
jgi:hypothetical protein